MGTATAGVRAGLPGRNSTSLDSTYSFDPSFHRHAAVIAYYAAEGKGVPGARAKAADSARNRNSKRTSALHSNMKISLHLAAALFGISRKINPRISIPTIESIC